MKPGHIHKMKDFLHRNVTLLSTLLALAFITVFLLFVVLLAAKEQRDKFNRFDQPLFGFAALPGPQNKISDRSRKEIDTLFQNSPYVIGGWAGKIHYAKTENPVIYYFAKDPIMDVAMRNYDAVQKSGRGFSSAELDAATPQSASNTEEAKSGIIRCGPLSTTNIAKLAPGLSNKVKGVCRATIPPFDENVNLAIVVLINNDGSNQDHPDIIQVRRTLLQLQIDIFNRDFKGRETWAHP